MKKMLLKQFSKSRITFDGQIKLSSAFVIIILSLLFVPNKISAQALEDFTGRSNNTNLNSGSSGTGWNGNWTQSGTQITTFTSFALGCSGSTQPVAEGSTQSGSFDYTRFLSQNTNAGYANNSGVIWVYCQVAAGSSGGGGYNSSSAYGGIGIYKDGTEKFLIGARFNVGNWGITSAGPALSGAGSDSSTAIGTYNCQRLVAKIDQNSNTITLYISPDFTKPECNATVAATASFGTNDDSFNKIVLRAGGGSNKWQYDNLNVTTTSPFAANLASVITAPSGVCPSSTGNLASVSATTGASYAWTITGGTITAGTGTSNITFSANASGNVVLNCTVSLSGCTNSGGSQNTTVPIGAPDSTITAASPVCSNATGNSASVLDAGVGATYTWTISGGSITAGTGTRIITYTAGASGSVILNCTVLSAGGCSSGGTQNTSVTINAIPSQTISSTSPVCANSTGNTASVATVGATYAWTISGGTITSATTIQQITYTAGASGSVSLSCVVTANGCSSVGGQNTSVTINAIPTQTITASSGVCGSSTGNTASVPVPSGTGISYAWTISGGTITSATNIQQITYTAGTSGAVSLSCVVTANGCSSTGGQNTSVSILATPTITPTVTNVTCFGGTNGAISLAAVPVDNSITYDGTITEASWGAPLATSTGGPTPGFGANQVTNALYATSDDTNLNLAIAGNIQNGNRILVFIDSKTGGFNQANFSRTNAPGSTAIANFNSGTTFDTGFSPDYCLQIGNNGSGGYYIDLYTLGGSNTFLGLANTTSGASFIGANPDNTLTTKGFEVRIPLSSIGYTIGGFKFFTMVCSDGGFVSNQFLTRANSGEGNYGSGAVNFAAAAPNPVSYSGTTYAWSSSNPSGFTATTKDIAGLTANTYAVTVTSPNGCAATNNSIVVTQPADITVSTSAASVCVGSTLTLSPATGGTWTSSDATKASVTGNTVTGVAAGSGITFTYTQNSTGCTKTTSAISVSPTTPSAGSNGTLTICSSTTITTGLLFGALTGSPATGGTWSPALAGAGTYTYTQTGVAPCGNNTATVIVTVQPTPASAGSNGTLTICSTTTLTTGLLFGALTGSPAAGGTWSPALAGAGTYTYTQAATSPCTVDNTATVTVTVQPAPASAGSNGTLTICSTTTLTTGLLFGALTGSPATGGTWSPAIAGAGTYTYTQAATSPCSVNNTATVVVTVQPTPASAGTNGTLTVCTGITPSNAQLFAALGGSPAAGGTWSNVGLVYTYTQTAISPCAVNNTATVTVTEQALPASAGSNGTLSICSTTTLTAASLFGALTGSPATGGTWSPAIAGAGTYTYTQAATSPCSVNNTATVTVTVQPAPASAGSNGTLSICSTTPLTTGLLFGALTGSPATGGTWSPAPTGSGTYTYTQAATSPCTVDNTATVTVTVQPAPASAGSNGTLTICSTTTLTTGMLFSALTGSPATGGTWSPAPTGAGTYTYTQTATSPCAVDNTATVVVSVQQTPASAGSNGTLTICSTTTLTTGMLFGALTGSPAAGGTWSPAIAGAGTYTYTQTGVAPCGNNTATVTVTVQSAPASAGSNGTLSICSTTPLTTGLLFGALTGSPASGGTWSPALAGSGTYTYTQAATSPCTVNNTATVTVTVQPAPASAGSNGTLSICSTTTLTTGLLFAALGGSPAAGGTWSPALAGAGTYTYTQAATSPCTVNNTATVTVTVQPAPASAGSNGTLSICSTTPLTTGLLFGALTGSPATGGTWSPALAGSGTYTYTQAATSPCTVDNTATVTVTVQPAPASAGSNGTLSICSTTPLTTGLLFGALTGSPATGGTWSPAIAGAGTYTYTQAATSPCTVNNTATVTVTVQPAPASAGSNGTLSICSTTPLTTGLLFGALTGSPATGGTWSPALAGSGTYTYTQAATSPCTVDNTATVTVTVQPAPASAGSNGTLSVCSTTPLTTGMLFGALGGSPASGGTWSPAIAGAGMYTYIQAATSPCTVNNTATVTVTVQPAPASAGSNGTLTICSTTTLTTGMLFGALTGSPATGGTWSPTPAGPGTYTYTQAATSPCSVNNTATVVVSVVTALTWYQDIDGDGYGNSAVSQVTCTNLAPAYSLVGGDCNDAVATINPGVTEICYNNIDDNCDGNKSETCAPVVVDMVPSVNNTTLTSFSLGIPALPYTYGTVTNLKYRFSITNVTTGVTATDVINDIRFVSIPTNIRLYGARYTIKASAVINDEVVPFAGNTITVFGPTVQTVTLGPFSCGATLSSLTSSITANPGLNATSYTFRIRLASDNGPTPTYGYSPSATRFITANSFTGFPLQYSTSYKVAVQFTFIDPVTLLSVDSGYGTECTLNTSSIPLTSIASPSCGGAQLTNINATVSAFPANFATGYRFRIRLLSDNGPTPTYYYTPFTASRFSSLGSFQSVTLSYNTQYVIAVEYTVLNGTTTLASGFGPDCVIKTPFFPVTNLVPTQCGLVTPTSLTQTLYITPYPGFPNYKVKLETPDGEGVIAEEKIFAPSNFKLSDFTIAQLGKTYSISVAIKLNGIFGDYSTACDVFTAAARVAKLPFKATAYPNPFANNFMLDVTTSSRSVVGVKVYDMIGRLIEQREVSVSDLENATIGDRYPSGVYNVVVSQEDSVQTVRVVKR